MKKYFANCETLEDVKSEYKRLAKLLHPDCGGNAEEFKRMHNQYEAAFERCKNTHLGADGEIYTKETAETPEEFAAIISQLITLPGLEIELCGRWLWIGGDTYSNRAAIKAAGCTWHHKKKLWYWHPADQGGYKPHGKREIGMDEIRRKYGSALLASTPGRGPVPQLAHAPEN